jgi:biopolymer transport protein ExbB
MARSQLDTLIFRDFSDFQLRHWQGDVGQIVRQVATERELSGSEPSEGFERRTTLRIKHVQYVAQRSRAIGVPLLLIISLIAPFVGLFGSLFALLGWLTTLTDVHPMSATSPATPFAEALLTLEVGMMAAIPASACYFHLRHKLENYYALLNEAATHVILIVSRNQEKSVAQRNRNGRVSA